MPPNCMQKTTSFMGENRSYPGKVELLQRIWKSFFLDLAPWHWAETLYLFFFLVVKRYLAALECAQVIPGGPWRCTRQSVRTGDYKLASKLIFGHFNLISHFSHPKTSSLRRVLVLQVQLLASTFFFKLLFCIWGKCPFRFLFIKSYKYVGCNATRKHARNYFIFGIYIFCLYHLCYDFVGKYFCSHA